MAISTGGAVPAGADAVVPIEIVVESDNELEIPTPVEPGANVRPLGGDIRAGDLVLAAGTRIGAAQIGALAAAGVADVVVARRPRVAVLSTGTELRAPGETLEAGQIYESNAPMLAAAFEAAGAEVERIGPVADDEAEHRRALEHGLEADVLVSSGGVSVGPHDLVRADPGRARGRGGLLGCGRSAGKAARVRRSRTDARLRAPGQPRLRPRRRGAVRASRRCSPCRARPTRSRRTRPPGSLRRCAGIAARDELARARSRRDARRDAARAADRPGVAHDRPGGRRRRARARAPPARASCAAGERVRYLRLR